MRTAKIAEIFILLLILAYAPIGAEESPADLLAGATSQSDYTLVDPELSNTPLPKLVLPPEAPAGLRLPELIVKADEWKGVQCGVQDSRYVVFQHADKWATFWEKAMAPYSARLAKTPPIDFDKDMVIGVFMGERRRPNFEIEILSSRIENRPDAGNVLVVRYREITKMEGVFVPPFAIQPFHLKKIPRFEGAVVFTKVRR